MPIPWVPPITRRRFAVHLAALLASAGELAASAMRHRDASPLEEPRAFLIRDGRPIGKIFLAIGADPEERAAATELNHHFLRMSGTALEISEAGSLTDVSEPGIVLGRLANALGAEPHDTTASREGFRIVTREGLVLIGSESGIATAFGAYRLLEEFGCEWVMPGRIGEIIPNRRDLPVPVLDIAEAPAFLFRNLWYGGGRRIVGRGDKERLAEWLRRQKGHDRMTPARQTGGHSWDGFIRRHRAEFDADPTMYALRPDPQGELERGGPQIETTHPRVIGLMVEDIKATFRRRGWPHDHAAGFPIGPSDGLGFSRSPESLAAGSGLTDPVSGEPDVTDLVVLFGNSVIERLGL